VASGGLPLLTQTSAIKPRSASHTSAVHPNWVSARGLPLRIGRASGSANDTSRSGMVRLPRNRSCVWANSRQL
jgi:hypothetical protein